LEIITSSGTSPRISTFKNKGNVYCKYNYFSSYRTLVQKEVQVCSVNLNILEHKLFIPANPARGDDAYLKVAARTQNLKKCPNKHRDIFEAT
jgi:hypothetical protein